VDRTGLTHRTPRRLLAAIGISVLGFIGAMTLFTIAATMPGTILLVSITSGVLVGGWFYRTNDPGRRRAELSTQASSRRVDLFWRRLGASMIDLFLCFFIPFWIFATPPDFIPHQLHGYWIALVPASVFGYVTLFTVLGVMPGMLVTGVRIRRRSTGRRPNIVQGIGRGTIALLGAASSVMLMIFGFSDPPMDGYSSLDTGILVVTLALFAISILGRLWMLIDYGHRTLFDRLLGLVVSVPERAVQRVP
jgi:hypothetical protein